MKSIKELIPDIYRMVKANGWFREDISLSLSAEIAQKLSEQFNRPQQPPRLRLSQMGQRCPRALWYSIHRPELAEAFTAPNLIKFSYGHILEALAIAMAKGAGHLVQGEQDELDVLGIKGHRDCVIDGCIVDVKSASTLSFKKFEDGSLALDDPFGYLDQLDGYLVGSAADDLVRSKDVAYILAIDKTLGKLALYEHHKREASILARVALSKEIVARDEPPTCTCEEVTDGESGNIILGVTGSYNPYKWSCKPHLRCFIYSGGPRFFTRTVKIPKNKNGPLIEVDKNGQRVYTN